VSALALSPAAPCPDCVFRSKLRPIPMPDLKTGPVLGLPPMGCGACDYKGKVSLLRKWSWGRSRE
jgi:hypothetical protein